MYRLASFNLYQFLPPPAYFYEVEPRNQYTTQDWRDKNQWILRQLKRLRADVIGFQEVFDLDALQRLCQQAGFEFVVSCDKPQSDDENPAVMIKPIVALASRYPLKEISAVEAPPSLNKILRLTAPFEFSRKPLTALVDGPHGQIRVYACHLKSKRPIMPDPLANNDIPWIDQVARHLRHLSCGHVGAQLQRDAEAAAIYWDINTRLSQDANCPIIVLGDLNDREDSTALDAITMRRKLHEIEQLEPEDWPEDTKNILHDFRLRDAFNVSPNTRRKSRPYTHIYRGKGSTLDYILVSNAANPLNPTAKWEVVDFHVFNRHLNADGIPDLRQSDHGQVMIEVRRTRDETNLPNKDRPILRHQSRLQSRQDFIDLAGGVYQTTKHYQQWSSEEKWKNFWSFFFENDYGWVSSVYGELPVSELHQKSRHSIEHIIPQDFLDKYFKNQATPKQVRIGASANPLNFMPSERGLNAKRSNFPFDMDGNKVIFPEHLDIDPSHRITSGLDSDNEWVLPARNRGDVARAILYMLLIYDIDTLYRGHLNTLVHWCKVDSPSSWEIAYNTWVEQRLGIRNPLIDTPENTRHILNHPDLLESLIHQT